MPNTPCECQTYEVCDKCDPAVYQRLTAALVDTSKIEHQACGECGMSVGPEEYHPYAACLMFKTCNDPRIVRANLQAVQEHGQVSRSTPPESGIGLISRERRRSIAREEYHQRLNQIQNEEFSRAAACHILHGLRRGDKTRLHGLHLRLTDSNPAQQMWPWHETYWEKSNSRLEHLIKAGSLVAAEIDRLLQAKDKP